MKRLLIIQIAIFSCLLFEASVPTVTFARDLRYDSVSIEENKDSTPDYAALAGEYAQFLRDINGRLVERFIKIPQIVEGEFAEELADNQKKIDDAKDFDSLKRAIDEQKEIRGRLCVREEALKNETLQKFAEENDLKKQEILEKRTRQYANLKMRREYRFHLTAWDRRYEFYYYCVIPGLDCVYPKGEWIYTRNINDDGIGIGCTKELHNLEVKVVDGVSTARQPLPGSQDGTEPLNREASGINLYASLKGLGWKEGTRHADLVFTLEYRLEDSVCIKRALEDCNKIF